ncbi:MAG: hypothetical protein ACXAB4_11485, partial [Candidatus Hodarchaeales archaeon]
MYSISLALVLGLVALAPIYLHAWDGANSEYLDIVKRKSEPREAREVPAANGNGGGDDYDGAEDEYWYIVKKKPLDKEPVADPPRDRVEEAEIH